MPIYCLSIVFLVIVAVLWLKRPLYMAIISGIIASILLFQIPFPTALEVLARQSIARDTIDVLLSFYFVTFLQKMLEKRDRLKEAQRAFNSLPPVSTRRSPQPFWGFCPQRQL